MDTRDVERAAFMFYRMCAMHHEICPHDYEWSWSKTTDEGHEEHYRCNICETTTMFIISRVTIFMKKLDTEKMEEKD